LLLSGTQFEEIKDMALWSEVGFCDFWIESDFQEEILITVF
jgi:hypothetical protein